MQSKSRILLACAAILLILSGCNADDKAKSAVPAVKEPAAATVNGIPISKSRVDMLAKQAVSANQPDTPESRATIINNLALQMLAAEEAIKKGLDKSPEVMDQH